MHIQDTYLFTENTVLSELNIAPTGQLTAPEGKLLSMTVDGIQMDPLPGQYQGDIHIYVTDFIDAPIEGMHAKPGDPPTVYRGAVIAGENGLDENNSVLEAYKDGTLDGTSITGGSITTQGEAFNGMILTGGKYHVKDMTLTNTGHSPDDGKGLGAAILVGGDTEAVFENMNITTQGIRNDAIVTGRNAKILVKNSTIDVQGGTPEQIQAVNAVRPGKACMTFIGGGWGTTRAINVENDSSATFENCKITAGGWGVLSTDGISSPKEWRPVKTRLHVKNCDVAITGRYGYGSYSIGDCTNIFENTRMYSPDVAYKVANELAGGQFIDGSQITGGRFGVMFQSNQGGEMIVKDSTLRSGRTSFIVRQCFPKIYCENAVLEAGNNVILQLFDSDDPGFGKSEYAVDTEEPVKDPTHDVTRPNYHPLSIWGFQQESWCTDLQATFKDMTINGDFYNGITNAAKPKMMPGMPGGAPSGKPDGKPGGMPPMGKPDGAPAGMPPAGKPDGAPAGMPPMNMKSYPINLVLTMDNVKLEGVVSASRAKHAVKTISGENRREIYQVYDTPCPVVNNGVILTLKNGSVWTVTGKSYLSALHVDETSLVRTPDGCAVKLVVNGEEIPYAPGDYTGDILVSAHQVAVPSMF